MSALPVTRLKWLCTCSTRVEQWGVCRGTAVQLCPTRDNNAQALLPRNTLWCSNTLPGASESEGVSAAGQPTALVAWSATSFRRSKVVQDLPNRLATAAICNNRDGAAGVN